MTAGSDGINAMNLSTGQAIIDGQTATTSPDLLLAGQDSELAKLPRELLDHVSRFLPTLDFNKLRLTCKLVENKTFTYWSNTFFKKRQFMVTPFSLQTLVDISRHATLGPCLTHLIIGIDHMKAIPQDLVSSLDDHQQCKLAADAQESLFDTGIAVQLFSTALLNLRNLRNIDIRDFNSYTRYRDASINQSLGVVPFSLEIPAWKSYGYSRLRPWSQYLDGRARDFGLSGRMKSSQSHVDRILRALVAALSQSGAHLRGLEVLCRHSYEAVTDAALAVSSVLDMTDTKLPLVLSGLNKLHLDVDFGGRSLPMVLPYPQPANSVFKTPNSAQDICDPATANLRKFLGLVPNLTWLRLNSMNFGSTSATRLLFWLGLDREKPFKSTDEADWSVFSPKPVSPPLRRLDLGGMTVDSNILSLIVQKFDQLECLSLRNMTMSEPVHLQQGVADGHQHATMWPKFFQKLPTLAPNLKHLLLKRLSEDQQTTVEENKMHFIVFGPPYMEEDDRVYNQYMTRELNITGRASLKILPQRICTEEDWIAAKLAGSSSDDDDSSSVHEDDDLVQIEDGSLNEIDEEFSEA